MLIILILSLLGLLVYSNSFSNSFHFDDFPCIVNNDAIKNFAQFHHILASEPTRVVTFYSFFLNYHWGGLNVVGYHVVSLLIHVATSVLVWRFVLLSIATYESATWIAFFTAAIFLTHPLQTQSVNYIYQRSNLLAAFFYMAALVLYIESNLTREGRYAVARGGFYYAGSLICAFLSLLSKENAVSLPFMICFCQWFFFRGSGTFHWKKTIPFFLVILILPFSWGLLNLHSFLHFNKTMAGISQGISVQQYALTQGQVLLTYFKLLFAPFHQRVEYDYTPVSSFFTVHVLGSLFLLALILSVALMIRKKWKLISFGIFWFFITLMPESSFWPNRDLIYEHRLYLPMFGFALFLSSGVFYFFRARRSAFGVGMLVILIGGYSFLSHERNKIWLNDLTLWDNAVRESPKSSRAYLNRGAAYQSRGDFQHAMEDYNMAIGLGNVDVVTFSNRGLVFELTGNPDLALANFNFAIKINPSYAGTYYNRALLYKNEGRYGLALADYDKALEFRPDDVMLYELRAETYFLNKEYDQSWADIQTVKRLGVQGPPPFLRELIKASGKDERS